MKVVNKSRKIIAIDGEPLLPGKDMELPKGYDKHPAIVDYLKEGVLADAAKVSAGNSEASGGLSDLERAKIAEEAIAKYKAEQKALAEAQAAKEAEIKAVKTMKKAELLTKAVGMGLEIADNDGVEVLKEKIIAALEQ